MLKHSTAQHSIRFLFVKLWGHDDAKSTRDFSHCLSQRASDYTQAAGFRIMFFTLSLKCHRLRERERARKEKDNEKRGRDGKERMRQGERR